MKGGRIKRGWALTKQSWAVLRSDRSLMLFPVIAAFACLAAGIILFVPGVLLMALDDGGAAEKVGAVVLWLVGAYAMTFIALYCSTALTAAAAQTLEGRPATVRDGFVAVRPRRGVIAQWALVQVTVGLLLNLIQGLLSESAIGRVVAAVISTLAGLAWAVATFFVLPILALEGLGPRAAFKRSLKILRERWGEGLVGSASIGAAFVLVLVPIVIVGVIGVQMLDSSPATGGVLLAIAVVLFVLTMLVVSTLNAIFRVALFKFATEDRVIGGFSRDAMEHAFRQRGHRGRPQVA